jgi:hypothetical protein
MKKNKYHFDVHSYSPEQNKIFYKNIDITEFYKNNGLQVNRLTKNYKKKAIQDFIKYGLQWDSSLKKRVLPAHIDPVIPGWENPPLHTLSQYQVSVDKDMDAIENTYWVANFFFIPNYFYFPDLDSFCRLESPKVKLKEIIRYSPFFTNSRKGLLK